jgi:biotin operon repressor
VQKTTLDNLRSLAPDLLVGKLPYPIPAYAQHAISILKILDDGEWHTAAEIAEELGIGKKYVRDILRTCKEPWGLAVSNPHGWMLVKPDSIIIL